MSITFGSVAGIRLDECLVRVLEGVQNILICGHIGNKEIPEPEISNFAKDVFKARLLISKEAQIENISPSRRKEVEARKDKLEILMGAIDKVVPELHIKAHEHSTRLTLEKIMALSRLGSMESFIKLGNSGVSRVLMTDSDMNNQVLRQLDQLFSQAKTLDLVGVFPLTQTASIPQLTFTVTGKKANMSVDPNQRRTERIQDLSSRELRPGIDFKRLKDILEEHFKVEDLLKDMVNCTDNLGVKEATLTLKPYYKPRTHWGTELGL